VFVGTREFAPPEQWGEQVVPASDLYALGATLFQALTGRPPYEVPGRDANEFRRAHTRAPIPEAHAINPSVPPPLSRLIARLLAKQPADRGTPAELIEQFRALLPPEDRADTRTIAPPPRPIRPTQPAPTPPPKQPAEHEAPPESEEHDPLHGVVNAVFGFFERIYLPPHLRPAAGHEPPLRERIAVLLRRPLVLITIAVLVGVLVFLILA
jgi:serine/threonine protein kinase